MHGETPVLRRTTDSGQSWQVVNHAVGDGLQFMDRNLGWTFGTDCGWFAPEESWCWTWQQRSTNGGASWSDWSRPGIAVFYLDANRGWGIGSFRDWDGRTNELIAWDYSLERTTDSGASWTRLWESVGEYPGDPPWHPSELAGLVAADAERVWTWGTNPVAGGPVAASTDGGATWVAQRAEAAQVSGVRFDRTGSAYASGSGTLRYRNTEIAAYRAARPPQIDGNLADWTGVPAYLLNAERAYRVLWSTPTPLDASATLQAAWDAGHLYFALRVYDDVVKVDSGVKPWQDDAIEIGLDGRHDHVRNWSLNDDRQFTVTALGKIYESGALLTDVPVARAKTSNGYILEFAIPKAKLGELGLASGALPGLNWTLIDDDDGGNAEAKLEWTGTGVNAADASWGQLRLSVLEVAFSASGTETPTPTATATATLTQTPTATPSRTATPTITATRDEHTTTYCDAHRHCDAHAVRDAHCYGYAFANTNANTDRQSHADCFANADRNADLHAAAQALPAVALALIRHARRTSEVLRASHPGGVPCHPSSSLSRRPCCWQLSCC